MDSMLNGLNAAQRAAVTSPASILQVLAPPGSGKTKTLTSRVAYLLQNGYKPQNVICCTFTIKASREMRERLRGLVGNELESKLVLGTFHSICRRYLVAYGNLIDIPKNFGIADSNDTLSIIKRLQKKMKFGMEPRVARNKISHRKARGQRLADVLKATSKSVDAQEFATIFQEYETALTTSNLLDYDDLLLKCVDLLREHPQCVSNVEALLIDEFQDTNIVQFELMRLLAAHKNRITIVGDPDQSIYGFRSAEIANLKRMQETYPETVVINLEENYRSSSAVLNLAQAVIEQDEERPNKKLKSTHCYGTLPVLRKVYNPHEEAVWIVSEIKRMTKMTGGCLEHNDIAILLRSAFLSLLIEKALANAGIPYRMVGGRRFFDRVEVRIILDYMRTICHPDNNSAFIAILNTPSRKIGDVTVAELGRAAEQHKISMWSTVQKVISGEITLGRKLNKPAEKGLSELIAIIKKAQSKLKTYEPSEGPSKLIEFIVSSLRFQDYLKSEYKDDWEERWENIRELSTQAQDVTLSALTAEDQLPEVDGVKQAQIDGAHEVLTRFLANVALSTEVEEEDQTKLQSRVTISTIHSAKGLEWPVVFVPAVYEGSIPHSRAEDTDEERRLLYVALTRAKALLYMTFPVMQSRSESESILTQFLPGDLDHLLNSVGPAFHDPAVKDIASILGREMPSQEVLAQAVTSLEESESQYDDLWPEDGSQKARLNPMQSDFSGVYLQSGQSLADAIKINTTYQQTSSYSTMAGFTTASHQLSVAPKSDTTEFPEKPKAVRSSSGQGSIATFFSKGTFKETQKENIPPSKAIDTRRDVQQEIKRLQPTIPVGLKDHKLGHSVFSNPASALKRVRPSEAEASTTEPMAKRTYTTFTQPRALGNTTQALGLHSTSGSTSTYTQTSNNTTMSSIGRGTAFGHSSYKDSMLNTLDRPASLGTGLSSMSANNGIRKTLGVRRSMTGWADRKNK